MSAGIIASHYVAGGGGVGTAPDAIPNLVLWLSADAVTGKANGDTLAAADVLDLGPLGNHPTSVTSAPVWESTTGPSGGPAIRYNPGAFFTFGNIMSGLAAGEVMATLKSTNMVSHHGGWSFGTSPDTHYPYGSGTVYDDWGTNNRKDFVPSVAVDSWRRYNVWSAANDWGARLDETTQKTYATNTVAWPAAPKVGQVYGGGGQALRYGAVIVYSRKLTSTERDGLAAWLAANPSGGTP